MENSQEEIFENSLKNMNILWIPEGEVTKIKPPIGEGGFGKVYKGIYLNQIVAIKKIKLQDDEGNNMDIFTEILTEIQVIQKADNPKISKFFGLWKSKNFYHLIFEFIHGKSLKHCYEEMDRRTKLEVLRDLCEIISDLHSKRLIHRDIKPDNVMIEYGNTPRLIDFGVSKIAQKTSTFTKVQIGTIPYMAPEMYFGVNEDEFDVEDVNAKPVPVSIHSDIWSLGCMISEIFSGFKPWHRNINDKFNEFQLQGMFIRKKSFPIPCNIDEEVKALIKYAMRMNPLDRPSADKLREMIEEILQNE